MADANVYDSGAKMVVSGFRTGECLLNITYRTASTCEEEVIYKQTELSLKNKERLQALKDNSSDPDAVQAEIDRIRDLC